MTASRRPLSLAAALLAPALALTSGCDLLDQFGQSTAIVDVFATSYGSPDAEGNLPARSGTQLSFVNDMGWTVFINEAYVTTASVALRACDGDRFNVEMYWGALAEPVSDKGDYEVTGLGGARVNTGSYCQLTVEYAPLAVGTSAPAAEGTTVYIQGAAVKDDARVEFEWKTELALEVDVDLSEVAGGQPFRVREGQTVSEKLTVAKSYDSFFAGIDFAGAEDMSQADIDSLLIATLDQDTRAFPGTAP